MRSARRYSPPGDPARVITRCLVELPAWEQLLAAAWLTSPRGADSAGHFADLRAWLDWLGPRGVDVLTAARRARDLGR